MGIYESITALHVNRDRHSEIYRTFVSFLRAKRKEMDQIGKNLFTRDDIGWGGSLIFCLIIAVYEGLFLLLQKNSNYSKKKCKNSSDGVLWLVLLVVRHSGKVLLKKKKL